MMTSIGWGFFGYLSLPTYKGLYDEVLKAPDSIEEKRGIAEVPEPSIEEEIEILKEEIKNPEIIKSFKEQTKAIPEDKYQTDDEHLDQPNKPDAGGGR